jgi:hypothetical protein
MDLIRAHQRGVIQALAIGMALRNQQPAGQPTTPPTAGGGTTPVGPGLTEAEVIEGIQQGIATGLGTLNQPIAQLRQALNQGLAEVGRHVDHLGEQIENAAFGGDDQAAPILRELREGQTQINAQVTAANQGVQNLTTTVEALSNQVAGLTGRVVSLEGRRDAHAARRNIQSALAQRLIREGIPYEREDMPRLAAEIESRRATEDQVVERLHAAAPPPAPAPAPPPSPLTPTPVAGVPPTPASAPRLVHPAIIPAPVREAPPTVTPPVATRRTAVQAKNELAVALGIRPTAMLNSELVNRARTAEDIGALANNRLEAATERITAALPDVPEAEGKTFVNDNWVRRVSSHWLGVPREQQSGEDLKGFIALMIQKEEDR